MTLDQIRIFLAVAERGHVTRAAKSLNLTQSAVSAAIAALERQHDVTLFDRIGRGIALTEAGRSFVATAQELAAQAETAKLVLEDLAQVPRGRLRIFASQTVASYWLPSRLIALHEQFPEVEIGLTVGNTAQAAQAVQDGTADLGFVEGTLPPSDLRRQVVARDELILVMARDHALAGPDEKAKADLTPADYRALTWILREKGSGTRSETEAHLQQMGLRPADLDIALELPSNEAVLAAVASSACVSMLSYRAVGASRLQRLTVRRVTWTDKPVRPFAVLSHPARHRTRAVAAMLDLVREG